MQARLLLQQDLSFDLQVDQECDKLVTIVDILGSSVIIKLT